jgi:hypothetical protein
MLVGVGVLALAAFEFGGCDFSKDIAVNVEIALAYMGLR